MNLFLFGVGLLVTGSLVFWEWRRPDRRHLILRLVATFLAVLSLGLLCLPTDDPTASHFQTEAALWTAGSLPLSTLTPQLPLRFALPDAVNSAPPHTPVIPDVGTLRRHFPTLHTLQIFGDGLDPADLPALSGLQVEFHPSDRPATTPVLRFLRCPRELPLGEPLEVTGCVGGLAPGTNLPVSLEVPDGTKTDTPTSSADAQGDAIFTLHAAPLASAGRFVWQLRVGSTPESLGVSIVPPVLPRVLVLEGAPHFDTAALRRWYEGAGGGLMVRTRVGKANTQFAAAQGKPSAFSVIDAPLLSGFDLVLVDGAALISLPPEQRAALITAVERTGLGLLVRADAAVLPPDTPNIPADLQPFFPWKLTPVGEVPPGEERSVRPQWPGQTVTTELPVSSAPFAIALSNLQSSLVSDREDHTLVAVFPQGRGQIALNLVNATTRWQRENEAASFAAYWSYLFSRLSRHGEAAGRWSLVNGDTGPVSVDHPLTLRWSGPPDAFPAPGNVVAADATTVIPLAQDLQEPGIWTGTFWPRKPGWHRVTAAKSGTPLDFYVHPTEAWPDLQSARRRAATARFAADMNASSAPLLAPAAPGRQRIPPGWWFVLLLVAAGYLWTERRFATGLT